MIKTLPIYLSMVTVVVLAALLVVGIVQGAQWASRAPQPGLQVELIEIEGMTCVAVYTLNSDTSHEFAPIAGVSCNWDEYEAAGPVWVTR